MVFNNIEFCHNCSKMLMPNKGKIKCRCGYEKTSTNEDIGKPHHMKGRTHPHEKRIATDRTTADLPTAPSNFIGWVKFEKNLGESK